MQPLSPHASPCLPGHWEGSPLGLALLHLQPLAPTHAHRHWGHMTLATTLPSHPLIARVDSCAPGQPQEQTLVGGPHIEVELKPQLSSRGHATKEEKLKSLLAAVQTTN